MMGFNFITYLFAPGQVVQLYERKKPTWWGFIVQKSLFAVAVCFRVLRRLFSVLPDLVQRVV
jgi:hypothetical protein